MRTFGLCLLALALAGCRSAPPAQLVLWAWERPEDVRFLGKDAEVAVQTGFIEIAGERIMARGRYFPLKTKRSPSTAVVHVQIDQDHRLNWTPQLRARVAAAVLAYARVITAKRVQLDFEVRASQRQILLDVLHDLRRALPPHIQLSMTAIASWCETESWLADAPVDEVVPMLFRMNERARTIERKLAGGGDFSNPKCRTALAISTDTPMLQAPAGRRVYIFNPKSWTAADFVRARRQVESWR